MKFQELDVNTRFVIDTTKSKGTIYRKVSYTSRGPGDVKTELCLMLEEDTGLCFPATNSPVKVVT